jgi:hypothetical protein
VLIGPAISRRWRHGVSLGLGLPLLVGMGSARAADAVDFAGGGITTWFSLFAAFWALLGVRAAPVGTSGIVAAAGGVAALASAAWLWRFQRARVGPSRPPGRRNRLAAPLPFSPSSIPAGLDGEQVLVAARGRFMRLQVAWDEADVSALRSLTTPEMLEELMHVLAARGPGPSRTDVISLHAELLGLEELSAAYLASVEFSGLIRESAEQGAVPFRELWMLACMKDDTPTWRLARQQSLF